MIGRVSDDERTAEARGEGRGYEHVRREVREYLLGEAAVAVERSCHDDACPLQEGFGRVPLPQIRAAPASLHVPRIPGHPVLDRPRWSELRLAVVSQGLDLVLQVPEIVVRRVLAPIVYEPDLVGVAADVVQVAFYGVERDGISPHEATLFQSFAHLARGVPRRL